MDSILAERTETDEKLLRIAASMDEFEGYAKGQASRVAWIADSLGEAFNLASRDRFFLEQAALLHDIGEISMNREYIKAARELTTGEHIDLQRHPVIGEQETAKLGLPRGVQLIVRWHHEWWNGGGYPDGLEAEQTPLAARILRVADTFAALTADGRSGRHWCIEEANKYMIEWAGIEFDPAVVKAFLAIRHPGTREFANRCSIFSRIRVFMHGQTKISPKSWLAFDLNVLRRLKFESVALPFADQPALGTYLKRWSVRVAANDPMQSAWTRSLCTDRQQRRTALGRRCKCRSRRRLRSRLSPAKSGAYNVV